MGWHDLPPDILYPDGDDRDDLDAQWEALEQSQMENAPETDEFAPDVGPPWYCAGGCGYEVVYRNDFCGECMCEDDGDIW